MIALVVFIFWTLPIGLLIDYGPLPDAWWTVVLAIVPLGIAFLLDILGV